MYTTLQPMLDGSGRYIDIRKFKRGGAVCTTDSNCGRTGGLCIGGKCVCPMGRLCGDCTLTQTDLLYNISCATGVRDGGAPCSTAADCGNHGQCVTYPSGNFCLCNALWVCGNCKVAASVLARNSSACK
jgi:hypothetical protein